MIVSRYLQRNIHLGTLGALVVLVSLSLFFLFVRELDDIGQGDYGAGEVVLYILLSLPGDVVEFLPLAVLLGSMLGLGAMAGNSEIIALQASGVTLGRLLAALLQAAALLALVGFLLADWVVPASEASARRVKALSESVAAYEAGESVWFKDDRRVVHIERMLPNGHAQGVEIFLLDAAGRLEAMTRAEYALPRGDGWELRNVVRTRLAPGAVGSERLERAEYRGRLSEELLQVLLLEPRWMAVGDLAAYVGFLEDNGLDARAERLVLWQKRLQPLTIVIMCLLVLPFVLGAQRHVGAGHRLLLGIMLGLSFVVVERVLVQIGIQLALDGMFVALLPNLVFLALALYLLARRQSHGIGLALGIGARQR